MNKYRELFIDIECELYYSQLHCNYTSLLDPYVYNEHISNYHDCDVQLGNRGTGSWAELFKLGIL